MRSKGHNGIAIAAVIVFLLTMQMWPAAVHGQNVVIVPSQPAPVPLPPPSVVNPQPSNAPRKLDTFGDRVTRCQHFGATQGLQSGALDSYTRACANN